MINNEQRATGLQVAPQRYYDTTVIHHDDTTTRRYDDAIYSQAVKCSVDIPVCNDAASILSVNAQGQDAHATQCYNEQRVTNNEQRVTGLQVAPQRYYDTTVIHHDDTTTRRHDDAIYSQGGRRGIERTDKNFTKPLFSSATSLCKNSVQSRRSGMILLLVIALLVLLALMGTIFILMASTDRQSAYASNGSTSLNFAQQGVINTVRGLMLNQTLDQPVSQTGVILPQQTLAVGMYNTSAGNPQPGYGAGFIPDQYNATTKTGGQIARFWDYPEVGAMSSDTNTNGFYQSVTAGSQPTPTQYASSEPWLVNNQPVESSNYVAGAEVYYCPESSSGIPSGTPGPGREIYSGGTTPTFLTVASPTEGYIAASLGTSGAAGTGFPLLSTLSPYLYDPGPTGKYGGTNYTGGSYDIGWYLAGVTAPVGIPSAMVPNAAVVEPRWTYQITGYSASNNLQPTGTLDAMWNLLPYSSPNGTRYRFAVRIMDLSSLLNLNSGWIPSADPLVTSTVTADPYAQYGEYIDSAPMLNSAVNAAAADVSLGYYNSGTPDNVVNIQNGTSSIPGREGSYASGTYALNTWQNALNEYEIQAPNANPPTANTSLFGLNSEMDLLTAAGAGGIPFGSPYYSRLATLLGGNGTPPGTLGLETNYYGSGYRSLYTDYSWTRDIAAVTIPSVGSGASTIPAVGPAKLNLNEPLSASNVATFASQLYETLISCGYNAIHAGSFVANYLAYRFGNGTVGAGYQEPPYIASGGNLYMQQFSTTPVSITAMAADTNSYVGTTAQPFLNELEVQITTNGTAGNATTAGATVPYWSLELMNPYPTSTALNLAGWQIMVNGVIAVNNLGTLAGGGSPAGDIGSYNTNVTSIANGGPFAVVYSSSSDPLTSKGTKTPIVTATAGTISATAPNTILLLRPEAGAPAVGVIPAGYVVVDSMTIDFSLFNYPKTPTTVYADFQRDNVKQPEWGCDNATLYGDIVNPETTPLLVAPVNLGLPNTALYEYSNIIDPNINTNINNNIGMPLYDRMDDGYSAAFTPFLANAPTPTAATGYNLINIDDFNCIAREGNYYNSTTTNYIPLSAQIAVNTAKPFVPASSTTEPTFTNEGLEANLYFDFAYDLRAAYTAANATGEIPPTILSMTTLTDRSQSNTAAASALPGGASDLVRQAGKININTAGPDVLYSVFSDDGALWNSSNPPTPPAISLLVDDAIGFRGRLASTAMVPQFSITGSGGSAVVTVTMNAGINNYNGFTTTADASGFRSTADLLLAMLPTINASNSLYSGYPGSASITTLQQRDAAWADVENFITVRSDTFAVYGLVQALRLNPTWTNPGDYIPVDWYNANQGMGYTSSTSNPTGEDSISSDPTQNAEFILEGSRRFIAIIDRSYCNNGAIVQPHIVALKLLPQ